MNPTLVFDFQVDKEKNQILVHRSFEAPSDLVWEAWTTADILDQWWAPKPYQAITKSLDFREGGSWHYRMQGPEGDRHWCLFDYDTIRTGTYFDGDSAFCDEQAVISNAVPITRWENTFENQGETTLVKVKIQYKSLEDLELIVSMGFKEGFTMGLENLDQYIASRFYLRRQNKTSNAARVSTYLNFPGTTEQAFNFYKSVFKTEFINGIQRFDQIPDAPDQAPVPEELKKLVLHVELPILGGHILMATDAAPEMGFTVKPGNNMYINLEPDSREAAQRLFNELSAGGTVEMPLQDMFWGAYYGSFTDQFGIGWMINYQPR